MKCNKIIVTGGNGFLGKRVVSEFRARSSAEIIIPRRAAYDLTEQAAVRELIHDVKPDMVVHLAASVGGIGANRDNPGKYCYENLIMGSMLIEECRKASVSKVVLLGTICSYPKFAPTPFIEDDLWLGYPEETNAPYGLAKKMLLVQSQAYRQQYGLNSIYLMPVNLYGPEDNFDEHTSHVIPALIRKCVAAKETNADEIVLWGDGTPTREFLYVDDAARAIVNASELYNEPMPVNLGSGHEISIMELATLVVSICGFNGCITWDTSKPNGQPRRRLDVSKARAKFDFEAQVGLKEGLQKTVNWYLRNREASLVTS